MSFLPGIAIFFWLAGGGVSARQNSAAPARPVPARAAEDVGKTALPNSRIHLHLADFSARIKDRKDLAEVLLIPRSFDEEHGYVVDPRALVAPAK